MKMTSPDTLPIVISPEQRSNLHIMTGLAQKAFQLANYDMSPNNPVDTAIRRGLIVVERPELPHKITRMPGNGSFA